MAHVHAALGPLLPHSEEEGFEKALPLLFVYLPLHSLDSRLKKEIDQVLIRSFGADATQGIDVRTFALLGDDDNGMPLSNDK